MSIEKVKLYMAQHGRDGEIIELDVSSATVELAAKALNVEPGRIAKTLSFKKENECILVVCAGDMRIDNKKYKACFGVKAKMLTPDEALAFTGHAVGGICPFAIENEHVSIYTDISLQKYDTVFPACGSSNSAIELSGNELFVLAGSSGWVDVCYERV